MNSGASGTAATRLEAFFIKGGTYASGTYPDIDALFAEQADVPDRVRRQSILHRIQQLVHERTICAPLWHSAILNGLGPRVEEAALGLIPGHPFAGPYDDIRLKNGG
jgi:peptide/nickel transport system substrate-binding protein